MKDGMDALARGWQYAKQNSRTQNKLFLGSKDGTHRKSKLEKICQLKRERIR